jgi:hypothetical protein
MFKRITAAYSESPESRRALASAIHLARILDAELQAVTIVEAPRAYTAYADAVYGLAQNAPCSVLGIH